MSHALVFGGSGAIGRHVVAGLEARGYTVTSTCFRNPTGRAGEVVRDLRSPETGDWVASLDPAPSVFIHCAGVAGDLSLEETDLTAWEEAAAVNARAPFLAAQALARRLPEGGDLVFLGALDRGQTLPVPVHFAASQGTLAATTMALGRALGGRGFRVNMLAVGVLEEGLSANLDPALREAYTRFSALRRPGQPEEVARVACWLACENRYINGKVIPVNGGI